MLIKSFSSVVYLPLSKMVVVKQEKLNEYCVICQDWENHSAFYCPQCICKLCFKLGHVKLMCPKLSEEFIKQEKDVKIKQEPIEIKQEPIEIKREPLEIKQEPLETFEESDEIIDENDEEYCLESYCGEFSKHEAKMIKYITSKEFEDDAKRYEENLKLQLSESNDEKSQNVMDTKSEKKRLKNPFFVGSKFEGVEKLPVLKNKENNVRMLRKRVKSASENASKTPENGRKRRKPVIGPKSALRRSKRQKTSL